MDKQIIILPNDEYSQSSGSSKCEQIYIKSGLTFGMLRHKTDTGDLLQANGTMTRWAGHVVDAPELHTMPGPIRSR